MGTRRRSSVGAALTAPTKSQELAAIAAPTQAVCLADWQSRRPPPSARLAEPSAASGSGPQGAGPDGRPFSSRQEPSRKPPLAARARRGVSHRTRPRSGILSQATVKPGAPRAVADGSSRPRETQRDGAAEPEQRGRRPTALRANARHSATAQAEPSQTKKPVQRRAFSPYRSASQDQGRRSSSGSSLLRGIRSCFDTPSQRRIGLATKMDERVPTTIPISIVMAKP